MNETMKKYYQNEEEFLDEFSDVATQVVRCLNNEWKPDYCCDDGTRKNREYFCSTGELYSLTFDGAAVYHDQNGFSSVQIILKSSKRTVTVLVKLENGKLTAEKIIDKEN
ncbi:MAG: hypothetical protein HY607_06045 [Planctomycetes bacterium]|uniref:hypothetical protein n=1 Tax=Candidatus Wujingus californicus TaxID=3367618 RepID=UPI004026C1C3|nr:hypothetical protein [Planctomycetota bacterium]